LAARGEDEPKSLIYSGFYQNGALWHTDVLVTPPPTIKKIYRQAVVLMGK